MAVSKRLRFEILRRDNHQCRYCGATAPDSPLTVDHVVPKALGGQDEPANLVTACKDCNAGKSSVPADAVVVADVAQNAAKLAAARVEATEKRLAELADIVEWVECAWTATWLRVEDYVDTSTQFRHPGRYYAPRPLNWESSVQCFADAGLDFKFLTRSAGTSLHADHVDWDDKWRYFCGICWREISLRDELGFQAYADKEFD